MGKVMDHTTEEIKSLSFGDRAKVAGVPRDTGLRRIISRFNRKQRRRYASFVRRGASMKAAVEAVG